jgi:hypothetical protein
MLRTKISKSQFLFIAGIILILIILSVTKNISFSFYDIFGALLFFYINFYLHEFGHAFAGIAVGFPIKRITIGSGNPLIKVRICRVIIVITNSILGGKTNTGIIFGHFLKLRYFILVIGGVVMQGIAICIAMKIFKIHIDDIIKLKSITLHTIFIYASILSIVENLLPIKTFNCFGVESKSDGRRLINLLFFFNKEIDEIMLEGKIYEYLELYEDKQFSAAELGFRECIKSFPNLLIPKICLASALINQLKLDDATNLLDQVIKNGNLESYSFPLYFNLAWIYFLRGNKKAIEKACEYYQKLLELKLKNYEILELGGLLSIEKGAVNDGIALLLKCTKPKKYLTKTEKYRINILYLAFGYYLKNDSVKALQYIMIFEQSDIGINSILQHLYRRKVQRTDNFGRKNAASI